MTTDPGEEQPGLRIFVSYRRNDSAGQAGRLHDALTNRFGDRYVFMDVDDIPPGLIFNQVLDRAVAECDVLLALIGPRWLARGWFGRRRLDDPEDFVRVEISAALERGILIIPVLVQDTRMPGSRQLPGPLARLAGVQAHELSDRRWGTDVGRLIDRLEKIDLAYRRNGEPPEHPTSAGKPLNGASARSTEGCDLDSQRHSSAFLAFAGVLLVFAALRFAMLSRALTGADQVADGIAVAAAGIVGLALLLSPARSGAAGEAAAGVLLGVSPFVVVRMWWSAQLRGAVPPLVVESPLWVILVAVSIVLFLVARSPRGFHRPRISDNATFISGVAVAVGLVAVGSLLQVSDDDLATLRLSDPILLLASAVLAGLAITTRGALQAGVAVGWVVGLCGVMANTLWLLRHTELGISVRVLSTHLALAFLAVIVVIVAVALRRGTDPQGRPMPDSSR